MATLLLSAAGAAAGGAVGGSVLGLTGAALGQAVGATLGAIIDQRLLGGSMAVEGPRLDSYRIQGASEGTAIPWVVGRTRVAGQVIWATRYRETTTTQTSSTGGGGKGGGGSVSQTTHDYTVSLALALCEGEVQRIGRVWADGQRIDLDTLNWRLHGGSEDQLPDPLISAVEGSSMAPAYRGLAYLVLEDLPLGLFGNRVPQINVEVFRRPQSRLPETDPLFEAAPKDQIAAVALIPGTGEYSLASEPVRLSFGPGSYRVMNVNNDLGQADLLASLDVLSTELPAVASVLLVVSWFGDDLRASHCTIRPKVEQTAFDGVPLPWEVSGLVRGAASTISKTGDKVNFGGTPADQSIVQAIAALRAQGMGTVFYPFLLMDVPAGNGLPNPWAEGEQPAFPWRGRISASVVEGRAGATGGTAAATAEVAAFMGAAQIADFTVVGTRVLYSGPQDWGLRRMILHYAHLCAAAGGVDAFCIGSELRGLTQIRDGAGGYPFVDALRALVADVRTIMGPDVKLSYAADWSEYFGHHPADGSGDVTYHLDPFWADDAVDFVGIDNYMPLSDWREGDAHLDAHWRAIHNPDYLRANVEGGEGYDWFYVDEAARAAQDRTAIEDTAYGDHHVFRIKDLRNWWGRPHFNRPGGVRSSEQTPWEPEGKPIWFTEYGCPAVDKGTNQPNVFADALSSESALPHFSTGARDDFIQYRYLQAVLTHWADPENNPVSLVYDAPMIDLSRAHVWAWDARPWPDFPNRVEEWSDGPNHARGHWISGRMQAAPLAEVAAELAGRSGVGSVEVSGLHGGVTGFDVSDTLSARAALQPLMLAFGFDAHEQGGTIAFRDRSRFVDIDLPDPDPVVEGGETLLQRIRQSALDTPSGLTVEYLSADQDYRRSVEQVRRPEAAATASIERSRLPLVLSAAAARAVSARFAVEAAAAIDRVSITLPPAFLGIEPGDVLGLPGGRFRVERLTDGLSRRIEAVRIDPSAYTSRYFPEDLRGTAAPRAVGPVETVFLDLPLMRGDELPHAPHVAVASDPWPGPVAVLSSASDAGYVLNTRLERAATMGTLQSPLAAARAGVWQRDGGFEVALMRGALESRTEADVLSGANVAALAHGPDEWEVIQFTTVDLIAPGRWRVSHLLRGQGGTEHLAAAPLPMGGQFVLLDGAVQQIDLPLSARGLDRFYRVGPASRSLDDPSFQTESRAFAGVGLRPYAPVHLRAHPTAEGELHLRWIRRTRLEGDLWDDGDVPLGEEGEAYRLRLFDGAMQPLLERDVTGPEALLTPQDLLSAPARVSVSQISGRWGAGLPIWMDL